MLICNSSNSPVEAAKGPAIVGLNLAVLWVLATEFDKAEKIVVTWTHSAPTSGDWIGMYLEDETERSIYFSTSEFSRCDRLHYLSVG